MQRTIWALLAVCLATTLAPSLPAQQPPVAAAPATLPAAPRRVKVLWLGDNGHHKPLERARQIYSALARRGVDLTYTDDVASLNPQNLARYDALLLYANIERIAPAQEQALLDYVASGKGFVPLRCGSYCFLNSPKITALVGGRFKSHGTGVFRETILIPDHPVERDLKAIESWDETYVHEMHNEQGRQVLGVRDERGKAEPYTWVRTHGRGRVFYTAWGHDERTFGNADFQKLLERGIRWAAGDWALAPQPALAAVPVVEAAGDIPVYVAGGKWGDEGQRQRTMPVPLPPAESMKHMVLPPGFSAKLFAADPDIMKPVAMAWDERGRLWIAETYDYPNELQPEGKGRDRIKICEDTNGDGAADKFTVFADKLSIPTSLCFANGGVIVAQAPHMLFFKDTNGDDVADERRVLNTGWATDDTHAGPSNLRWGFDNWVYGAIGYAGFKGEVDGKKLSFGQGLFRMTPDGSKLEFLGSANNNTWGIGFSEDGQIFASTANNNPSFYLHIPNRYYEQVPGMQAGRLETIADSARYFDVTEKVRQMDHHGNYTAGAGHALYTARSYPREYWNRVAFVTEPTAHVVGQFVLSPNGSNYRARNDFNFFASTDEWTAPIMAEVGPDGSVWVLDWYNYIVQHNPIPKGFEKGKGNAYVTPVRDKRHGRAYRIVYDGGTPSKQYDLSKATPAQLVEALKSDNLLWRMHAQRLLVERGDRSVIPALAALAGNQSVDEVGLNASVIHALHALNGLISAADVLDDELRSAATFANADALRHPSAAVRSTAVAVLPHRNPYCRALLEAGLLNDKDAKVRKAALLALSRSEVKPAEGQAKVGAAIYAMLSRKENANDRFLADAMTIAAARHDAGFLKAVFAARPLKSDGATPGTTQPTTAPARENLLPNASFEEATGGGPPKDWQATTWGGNGTAEAGGPGRTGQGAVKISSDAGGDISWSTDVPVAPNTDYTLSGWIKAQNVKPVAGGLGALFNIHGLKDFKTPAVTGDTDWKRVSVTSNSGSKTSLTVTCLFGGWGQATGSALYDDVELVRAGAGGASSGIGGVEGKVVQAVINQYARRGPVDSIVGTIAALKTAEPGLAAVVMDGLAAGWPKDAMPKLTEADTAELRGAMAILPPDARDRLLGLADKWGRADLFAEQLAAAKLELAASVADPKLDAGKRSAAARRLIAMNDEALTIDAVLKQVTPASLPDVQTGMLDALSDSRNPAVGASLVKQWPTLTPTAQKAGLSLLLRRQPWTEALLSGIKAGTVNGKDLQPQHWQVLTEYPDRQVVAAATALQKSAGRAPSADRKEIVDKLSPLADRKGDAAAGKLAFAKNCLVCHKMEGQGGEVGPDLTGIGAKARIDNLLDIIDPNRSVEGTYRQWSARTEDDVISGKLSAESLTSIEIIDAAGQKHPLDRKDIKRLTASDRSVMPEGFEQLPPQELTDLIEYMATSKVKH